MDRVGARNSLIILMTLVALTFMVVGVLLYGFIQNAQYDPPQALLSIALGLIGFFTGTQVSFAAKAKVNENSPSSATTDLIGEVAYQVRETAVAAATSTPAAPPGNRTSFGGTRG